jgi:hypothetical protein
MPAEPTQTSAPKLRSDPALYAEYMNEIKWRLKFLDEIVLQKKEKFETIEIENAALQMRMIFELIALSTIAAHRDAFERRRKDLLKDWNLSRIVKAVRKLNEKFFPVPIEERLISYEAFDAIDSVPIQVNSLSEVELVEFHGKCGDMLHAKNRYKTKINYAGTIAIFKLWRNKIVRLLNVHQVRLYGEDHLLVVRMQDQDGLVSYDYATKLALANFPKGWPPNK